MSEFLMHSPDTDSSVRRPGLRAAVVMRREFIGNQWQPWRWNLSDVVPNEAAFGDKPRLLIKDDQQECWLHPNFLVELSLGDAEGYYLNTTTEHPCFWVVWRMEEEALLADEPLAVPQIVTLSYHDAGRWLDAQENVEQVAAPIEVVLWLKDFVAKHHVLEAKRRQRPQSFKSLQDRFGSPARISTDKFSGGGGRG
jgi:hypothetical protein